MPGATPAPSFEAVARERGALSEHLVCLVLDGAGGLRFQAALPDEWVALTVPGQFETRYYTVRSWPGSARMVLDVVVHEQGLVTEWAQTECIGDKVGLSAPKGSFDPPEDAGWVLLAGDLTALPAMARIAENGPDLPSTVHAEVPDCPTPDYLAAGATWHETPSPAPAISRRSWSRSVWPELPGYFWMSGESAQMRQVRRHARHGLGWNTRHYDVMGYGASRGVVVPVRSTRGRSTPAAGRRASPTSRSGPSTTRRGTADERPCERLRAPIGLRLLRRPPQRRQVDADQRPGGHEGRDHLLASPRPPAPVRGIVHRPDAQLVLVDTPGPAPAADAAG